MWKITIFTDNPGVVNDIMQRTTFAVKNQDVDQLKVDLVKGVE